MFIKSIREPNNSQEQQWERATTYTRICPVLPTPHCSSFTSIVDALLLDLSIVN